MTLDRMLQEALKEAPKEATTEHKKLVKAYEDVMKTEAGQRVLAHIIASAGVFEPCDADPNAFLGARAVGINLMRTMEHVNSDLFKATMQFLFSQRTELMRASNGQ